MLISLIFPSLNHPLRIGLILILQTINVRLIAGIIIKSFWFSYVFVIIILRGSLVLFIYISRIASNEKFNISTKLLYLIIIIIIINIIITFWYDSSTLELSSQTLHHISSLNKLFRIQNLNVTIILALYLLLTMVAINYIVNISEGPLRSKN